MKISLPNVKLLIDGEGDRTAMPPRALNHMTVPHLQAPAVLALAQALGCVGVEFRSDLARPMFDGTSAEAIGDAAKAAGLRILALAEVKAFNDAPEDKAIAALTLIASARACGAEAIALIPKVGAAPVDRETQRVALRHALNVLRPVLEDNDLIGLIEPIGFAQSTLRHKDDAVAVLDEMDRPKCFRLVHDTFHHHISGDVNFYADHTGLIHVSGVSNPAPSPAQMADAHRGLIDAGDRLNNISQLRALSTAGATCPASFECFAPDVHAMTDPTPALAGSFAFIADQMALAA